MCFFKIFLSWFYLQRCLQKTNVLFLTENQNRSFINFLFTLDLGFLQMGGNIKGPLIEKLKDMESSWYEDLVGVFTSLVSWHLCYLMFNVMLVILSTIFVIMSDCYCYQLSMSDLKPVLILFTYYYVYSRVIPYLGAAMPSMWRRRWSLTMSHNVIHKIPYRDYLIWRSGNQVGEKQEEDIGVSRGGLKTSIAPKDIYRANALPS